MRIEPPEGLLALERLYAARGHEIVFVGGCVRDATLGLPWKDVDLATSATPDEQIALYREAGIRYFETGLQHGTITVILDGETYEITTYRTDVETDGRHATVAYTRDLAVDLERRDLTMNAMAMRFDGTLVDPFGGRGDALVGIVRFVGDADARLREDYLRILRWFRFLGRFSAVGAVAPDAEALRAVTANAEGLRRISVERIWSETARIITGPNAIATMHVMITSGVAAAIGLPAGNDQMLRTAGRYGMDPATTLGAYLADHADPDAAPAISRRWKMSNEERQRVGYVSRSLIQDGYDLTGARRDVVDGKPARMVADVLRLRIRPDDAEEILSWDVPIFPLTGADLKAAGMTQGVALGNAMRRMREAWIGSGYTLGRDELLADAAA